MAERDWMYSGWKRGRPGKDWVEHTKQFLDFAFSNQSVVQEGTVKCPCAVCRNYFRHKRGKVELHLCQNGFKSNYKTWTARGERRFQEAGIEGFGDTDRMDDMLADLAAAAPSLGNEEPTDAQAFYRIMDSAEQLVHDKTTHSTLSATARLLSVKAQQRVDDYFATLEAEYPDDCEQHRSDTQLDPIVLYKSSGRGLAHGRVPIANGAIRKAEMKGSGRRTNTTSQANSRSYQYLVRRNAQLEKNSNLGLLLAKHMKDVSEKLNMELPSEIEVILQSLSEIANANASTPPIEQATKSSHAGHAGSGGQESNDMEENEDANID